MIICVLFRILNWLSFDKQGIPRNHKDPNYPSTNIGVEDPVSLVPVVRRSKSLNFFRVGRVGNKKSSVSLRLKTKASSFISVGGSPTDTNERVCVCLFFVFVLLHK